MRNEPPDATSGVAPALTENGRPPQTRSVKHPKACYFIGGLLVVDLILAILAIIALHIASPQAVQNHPLFRAHLMCGGFGFLGATIASIRRYYKTLITFATKVRDGADPQELDWSFGWVFYYLTRPLVGGILGALVYLLSYVGLQVLADPSKLELSQQGRMLLYALSFVGGYGASMVLDRVDTLSRKFFQQGNDSR